MLKVIELETGRVVLETDDTSKVADLMQLDEGEILWGIEEFMEIETEEHRLEICDND